MPSLSAAVSLLALASAASAYGIVDNALLKAKIIAQSAEFNGNYYVQNKKTGEFLSFERPADLTNVRTSWTKAPIELAQGAASGMSGVNWGDYSGTILRGMTKCLSAQVLPWGEENTYGLNVAGVSYACTVGDVDVGTDTLEVAKQFWRLVPCGAGRYEDVTDDEVVAVNFAASVEVNDDQSTPTFTSKDAVTDAVTDASSTSSASDALPIDFDRNDRSTWVCKHTGQWLHRHYNYITEAGHIECADELAAYRAKHNLKRSTHARRMSSLRETALEKRASEGTFCIIAEDHLSDMQTRALGPNNVGSFGGYTSQELVDYDENDEGQHWVIYAA